MTIALQTPACVRENVALAALTTLGIGGSARFFATPVDAKSVIECLRFARESGVDVWLLGGGSNVVVADAGLNGLVLQPADGRLDVQLDKDSACVELGAGVAWDRAVAACVAQGLTGIECLSGIPGNCGAAPMQNIGAYGQQLSDVFESAQILDTRTLKVTRWTATDCAFGYRDSALKRAPAGSLIVLRITLRLRAGGEPTVAYPELRNAVGPAPSLQHVRDTVIRIRAGKGMVVDAKDPDSRSAGSFFVNPIVPADVADTVSARFAAETVPQWPNSDGVKLSAAWLIQHSGMGKGYGDGRVGLSSKHTLALVNRGGATASELLTFASHVQERVRSATGIALVMEPRVLGLQAGS
jgi:UDP-N-acetylmuramate dehydrogenase